MEERMVTGMLLRRLCVCASYNTRDSEAGWDLFITKTGGNPQDDGARDPSRERAGKDT
jgi:hypothetical protein